MKCANAFEIEQSLQKYGASLNAVWDNQHLEANEKHLMNYLTRSLNMNDLITDYRQVLDKKRIKKATGLSESTIKRVVKSLKAKGYLLAIKCTNRAGKQMENAYLITSKLFDDYRVFLTHLNSRYEAGDRTIFARESVVHKLRDADTLPNLVQHEIRGVKMNSLGGSNCTPSGGGQNDLAKGGQNEPPILNKENNNKSTILRAAPQVLPKNEIEQHRESKTEAESTNRPAPLKKPRKAIKNDNTPEVQATREIVEQFELVLGNRKITSIEFNKLKSLIKLHVREFKISWEEVTAVSKQAVTAYARSTEPFALESNHSFQVFIQGFNKYYCKGESMKQKRSYYEENEEYGIGPIVFEDEVS